MPLRIVMVTTCWRMQKALGKHGKPPYQSSPQGVATATSEELESQELPAVIAHETTVIVLPPTPHQ